MAISRLLVVFHKRNLTQTKHCSVMCEKEVKVISLQHQTGCLMDYVCMQFTIVKGLGVNRAKCRLNTVHLSEKSRSRSVTVDGSGQGVS